MNGLQPGRVSDYFTNTTDINDYQFRPVEVDAVEGVTAGRRGEGGGGERGRERGEQEEKREEELDFRNR